MVERLKTPRTPTPTPMPTVKPYTGTMNTNISPDMGAMLGATMGMARPVNMPAVIPPQADGQYWMRKLLQQGLDSKPMFDWLGKQGKNKKGENWSGSDRNKGKNSSVDLDFLGLMRNPFLMQYLNPPASVPSTGTGKKPKSNGGGGGK